MMRSVSLFFVPLIFVFDENDYLDDNDTILKMITDDDDNVAAVTVPELYGGTFFDNLPQ